MLKCVYIDTFKYSQKAWSALLNKSCLSKEQYRQGRGGPAGKQAVGRQACKYSCSSSQPLEHCQTLWPPELPILSSIGQLMAF